MLLVPALGIYHGLLCTRLHVGSLLLDCHFLKGRDNYFFVVPKEPGIFSRTQ